MTTLFKDVVDDQQKHVYYQSDRECATRTIVINQIFLEHHYKQDIAEGSCEGSQPQPEVLQSDSLSLKILGNPAPCLNGEVRVLHNTVY